MVEPWLVLRLLSLLRLSGGSRLAIRLIHVTTLLFILLLLVDVQVHGYLHWLLHSGGGRGLVHRVVLHQMRVLSGHGAVPLSLAILVALLQHFLLSRDGVHLVLLSKLLLH